jgi:hypothetical protein
MLIERLRVVDNDTIDTPEGKVVAPTTYFMDLELNEEESVAIPIDRGTYQALHNLATVRDTPEAGPTNGFLNFGS